MNITVTGLTTENIGHRLEDIAETMTLVRSGRLEPMANTTVDEDLAIQSSARQTLMNELHSRALKMVPRAVSLPGLTTDRLNKSIEEARQKVNGTALHRTRLVPTPELDALMDELHSRALERHAKIQSLRELAERVAATHSAIAFSKDPEVSGGTIYDNSLAIFKSVIAQAYPDVDAWAVWDVWADCQDWVSHCVWVVRERQSQQAQETAERLDDPDEVAGIYSGSRAAEDIQDEARTALRHAVESRDGMDFHVDTAFMTTAALALLRKLSIVEHYRGRVFELTATGKAVRRIMLQSTEH